MKYLFLLLIPFACSFSKKQSNIPADISKSDTCFYTINVPPDIDMPSTPYFDTTIVRSGNCKIHILNLQAWGTETEYDLSDSTGKAIAKAHFFMSDKASGNRQIDISNLPAGKYNMYLLACGNGGGFGLRIK